MEQLRSAIYALNHSGHADRSTLPELLEQLATVHMPEDLGCRCGCRAPPVELPSDVEHGLLRIAGEALFNTAMHGHADTRDPAARLPADAVQPLGLRRRHR